MATSSSIDNNISNYPCTICMGFCLENENCIQCDKCLNWFHKECVNLSKEHFARFTNNIDTNFTCTICDVNKKCEVCNKPQNQSENRFLYCVTCIKHFCDDCNPLSSDQIHIYRSTDKPFYCNSCSAFYPCKICSKHCYQDAIHERFITCYCCKSRVHAKCSKLTRGQLNKICQTTPYLCAPCIAGSLPFIKLSNKGFENTLIVENSKSKTNTCQTAENNSCALCVQCNNECEECSVCPNNFRVCSDCTTKCNYLDIGELNVAFSNQNAMTLIHANVRSLCKNLVIFERMLYRLDRKPDVICITETKLKKDNVVISDTNETNLPGYDVNAIKLPGYEFYHTVSTTSAGGAGLYVSDMCDYKIRNDLDIQIDGECEAKFLEIITANTNTKNIIVGSIYRHPHDNHPEFLSDLSEKIECIQKKYHVVILGDININTKDNSDKNTQDYKNTLLSLGLRNTINLPTRITETSDTVLDHILTNVNADTIVSGVITQDISDHLPICAVLNLSIKRPSTSCRFVRKFTPNKKDDFVNTFCRYINEDSIFSDPDACPYNKLDQLISHLKHASNQHFPVVKLSNKQFKKFKKPWMTTGILKSMERRDELFEKWLKTKDAAVRKAYNVKRNRVNRIIKAAQNKYDASIIEKSQSNVKKFWKNLNILTKRKQKTGSTLPTSLKLNGTEILNDPQSIANRMNHHFVQKGPTLASKLPHSNRNILQSMGPRNPHTMNFAKTSTTEVVDLGNALNDKMATGSDDIPSILIKWSLYILAPILADIFNVFVELGIYPEILKTAKVTPLHKKGDKDLVENFRAISILSQINKIFEKLIHARLTTFLNEHNILSNNQFGFRKGHNTSHAINHLSEQVIKSLERKKVCAILFIDLKAAFDTIDHKLLRKKLDHYGIRGNVLSLLTSYLSERKQYIKSGDIESTLLLVLCGVPQGSVLGPLLFIIYINDIVNACALASILYADDAALLLDDENVKRLKRTVNRELKLLDDWLISNKLTLNMSKTHYMLISNTNVLTVKDRKKFKLTIRKYTLHEVDHIKYLGVILDNKLNWNQHIAYLVTKLSQVAGMLYKVRDKLPMKSRIMVYNSLAGSYLNYGITSWGSAAPTALNKLKVMQNRLIRYITFSPPQTNVDHKFKSLNILTVDQLYFCEIAKFVQSIYNHTSPFAFGDYYQVVDHSYNTRFRQNSHFALPQPRTERGKRSCLYTGVNIWGNVPREFKQLSKETFKYRLKSFIIENGIP